MNKQKITTLIYSMLFIILIAGLFIGFGIPIINKLQERKAYIQDYSKHTHPLTEDVIQDLCVKFVDRKDDPRCSPGAIVFAPQFFDVIKEKVISRLTPRPSPDQIIHWLDRYKKDCEPPVKIQNIEQYYRCKYVLGGDQIYPFSIYFNMDGSVKEAIFSTGS